MLEFFGPTIVAPLLDLAERKPEIAKQRAVAAAIRLLPLDLSSTEIAAWIDNALRDPAHTARRARLALQVTIERDEIRPAYEAILGERLTDVFRHEGQDIRELEREMRELVAHRERRRRNPLAD